MDDLLKVCDTLIALTERLTGHVVSDRETMGELSDGLLRVVKIVDGQHDDLAALRDELHVYAQRLTDHQTRHLLDDIEGHGKPPLEAV